MLIILHELWQQFADFLLPELTNTQAGLLDQVDEIQTDVLPDGCFEKKGSFLQILSRDLRGLRVSNDFMVVLKLIRQNAH